MMKWFTGLCLACTFTAAHADTPLPFGTPGAAPLAPWHVAGLPRQRKPITRFDIVDDVHSLAHVADLVLEP